MEGPRPLRLLQLLLREKRLFGLQLVAASKGRLKRGTVYVTLGRMEEKGYITSTLEDPPPGAGGLPRRLYEPTTLGRRVVRTWSRGAPRVMPEFAQRAARTGSARGRPGGAVRAPWSA